MFTLREINQMEREMCSYLDWEVTVDSSILSNFEMMVKRDFRTPGPYPTYSLQMVSKKVHTSSPSRSSTVAPPSSSASPIPCFGQKYPTSPKPTIMPPTRSASSTISSYGTPPDTPETPISCASNTTSPASSASPATPAGIVDLSAQIASSPG
jgi:hypothetical protein